MRIQQYIRVAHTTTTTTTTSLQQCTYTGSIGTNKTKAHTIS